MDNYTTSEAVPRKTVKDLLREVSAPNLDPEKTPSPKNAGKMIMLNRTKSASRSAKAPRKKDKSEASDKPARPRANSLCKTVRVKTVKEVFEGQETRAKFCLPLGMASARELEL